MSTAPPGDDPLGWLAFVVTEVIPYLLREAGRGIAEIFQKHALWATLGALAALGLLKLLEFAFWVARKAWLAILLAAVLGVAGAVLMRL